MNNNPNQHITDFLNYYCDLPSPQYAVMLKGKWGSGKTHFINEYKNELIKKNKKFIYVSLYGVTAYDEIETKFLEVLHPKLYNKKTVLAGKIAKGLLKATLKVDLDDDGKPDGTISGQIPNLNTGDLLNTKDYILIFDDLERCSIDINDLLGYINYFVEHQDYRVILLANDEKFKSEEYKEIKEKLIGKTFEVVSNTELAYVSFIKEIKNNSIFLDYKENIIRIYKQSNYNNLRVFRQVILDFDRFYNTVILKEFKNELITEILDIYFILAIENKGLNFDISKLDEYETIYIDSLINKDDDKKSTIYEELSNKYNKNLSSQIILSIEIWHDILNKSIIDKDLIKENLLLSKFYMDENEDNTIKLANFIDLSDNDFIQVLSTVEKELKECKYTDITQLMFVTSNLLFLIDNNLYQKGQSYILDLMTKQLEYSLSNNLINQNYIELIDSTINQTSYKGIRFAPVEDKLFNNIRNLIRNILIKGEVLLLKKDSVYITECLKDKNTNELFRLLLHSNNEKNPYYDKPILSFIDFESIFNVLINNNGNSQCEFGKVLKDRYKHSSFSEKLHSEIIFLNTLQDKITIEQKNRIGKVSGYNLEKHLLKPLNKAINDLETHINNKKESII